MIYFDNAATTFPKPPSVIRKMNFCLKKYCGNPGRSSHRLSLRSSEAIYEVREKIADLLSVSRPEQVVFTYNATYALNLAIKTHVRHKCHILTSDFEHNSVIRPLEALKGKVGIDYSSFDSGGDVEKNLREAIRPDTEGIICSIASNLTGDSLPIDLLSEVAKEKRLFLIIDASQAIGHQSIDLTKTPCDVLCAPGHKGLFGIQGCGFAYFKDNKRVESFIEGGSGTDSASLTMPELLPEGYEAGTLSTPAIVSLGAGLDFIKSVGQERIREKLDLLTLEMFSRLEAVKGIKIYNPGCGIVGFNLFDLPSSTVASLLDRRGICVRGGLHCAPSVHRRLDTLNRGAVRVSFSYLNSIREVDKAYRVIKEIAKEI